MNWTLQMAKSQFKIPGLQRKGSHACVSCGNIAEAYCARCGVTPYCSGWCQRRDWSERHHAVCHNLARLSSPPDTLQDLGQIDVPAAVPLRRPRSPAPHSPGRRPAPRPLLADRDESGSEKSATRPPPLTQRKPSTRIPQNFRSNPREEKGQDDRGHQEKAGPSNLGRQGRDDRSNAEREQNGKQEFKHQRTAGNRLRLQKRGRNTPVVSSQWQVEEEDWDTTKRDPKPSTPPEEPKPKFTPKPALPRAQPTNQSSVKDKPTNHGGAKPVANEVSAKPLANQKEAAKPASNQIRGIGDATPVKKLIPKHCLIELLSVGDTVILSVEKEASESRTKGPGFICVSLHEKFTKEYTELCEEFGTACEALRAENLPYKPNPGDTCSFLCPSDGGWYRARWLGAGAGAALLDAGRSAPPAAAVVARLPAAYYTQPEFSCHLRADVKVGDSLSCVLKEKTATGYKVTLENAEDGQLIGDGEVSRWLPEVMSAKTAPASAPAQAPAPAQVSAPAAKPAAATPTPASPNTATIPEVTRPALKNNSKVALVHVTSVSECYVRAVDAQTQMDFDTALNDVATYGLTATPLKEHPKMGQYVVSKYTDGHHYRALVKRTNVKQNKYLLEYVEFGNTHINTLENLYACPGSLGVDRLPAVTSRVSLRMTSPAPDLTPAADLYLDTLKDDNIELILTLTEDGAKCAPSGCEVTLTEEASRRSVNTRIQELCTPEWMLLQRRGGSVLDVESIMYASLEFVEIPADARELVVLDFGSLDRGILSACPPGPHIQQVLTTLTEQIAKYCDSEIGKEPYLPKPEELCIAKLPPYPQWFRAVLTDQPDGPGGAEAEVCYIDYGNVERVPTTELRKMMPEFVRNHPALANLLEIEDFPNEPTAEMLERAVEFLRINDLGHGTLPVTRVLKGELSYSVSAPAFIAYVVGK